ncbi:carboxypeptidase-like regulatory domain-containing protein [Solirubrobacter sp. CPCC 204708]|uniref:Carboxypeptidase-like regulatory domain-containing protein n=2 Tax=Solirubrobacter deserti TaxID=2282478 RepID=A0ABT4RPL2_9ACTN|nr:carboxypeptidase-like regulatory domain-containing protein [Solirubrobacter deserti]
MNHARHQDGFALIEVIVSAAVLAVLALAVLSGLDGAGHASARERARAQASALAEQDQERLRSINFESLVDGKVPQTGAVKVADDKASYTVTSEVQWITDDDTGVPACGDKSYRATEYAKLISTVTSNIVGVRMKPVRVESMMATRASRAASTGTLTVRVKAGRPERVANLTVRATHATTNAVVTAQTNAKGCALFRSIPIGEYTVSLNTSGYVDDRASQYTETKATVSPSTVTPTSLIYDRSVNMSVDIKTIKPGATFSTTTASRPSKADSVADNAASAGSLRAYAPSAGGFTSNIKPTGLFPFESSYAFFAGACVYQSPTKANPTLNQNYFETTNPAAVVKGDPAAFQPQSATVYQPALNLRVRAGSSTNTPPATFDAAASQLELKLTLPAPSGDSCTDITNMTMRLASWPTAVWGEQPTTPAGMTATGYVWQPSATGEFDPGMPFGVYRLCLRDGATSPSRWWANGTASAPVAPTYDNTNPSGRADTMEIPPRTTGTGSSTVAPLWTTTRPAGC